jgi:hypothetical protein
MTASYMTFCQASRHEVTIATQTLQAHTIRATLHSVLSVAIVDPLYNWTIG